MKFDEDYMAEAIIAAERAKSLGDSPIGALLAMRASQLVESDTTITDDSPLRTAPLNVLEKAISTMPRRLANSVLYCTVEPTSLDVLAAHVSGVNEVVFGCYDLKDGFVSSKKTPLDLEKLGIKYKGGVLARECFDLLTESLKEECTVESPL